MNNLEHTSLEWEVLPVIGENWLQARSSAAGDSGSFVLQENGALAGLLVGELNTPTGQTGIVTPIKDVFKDIESFTGWKVELP